MVCHPKNWNHYGLHNSSSLPETSQNPGWNVSSLFLTPEAAPGAEGLIYKRVRLDGASQGRPAFSVTTEMNAASCRALEEQQDPETFRLSRLFPTLHSKRGRTSVMNRDSYVAIIFISSIFISSILLVRQFGGSVSSSHETPYYP